MKRKKIFISVISISVIIVASIVYCTIWATQGSFNKLIISKSKMVNLNFSQLLLMKDDNFKSQETITNKDDINSILSVLKNTQLTRISWPKKFGNTLYDLNISDKDNHGMDVMIFKNNANYIMDVFESFDGVIRVYRIKGNSLDIKYIDDIYSKYSKSN